MSEHKVNKTKADALAIFQLSSLGFLGRIMQI